MKRALVLFALLAWARLARADGDVHAEFRLDGRPHAGVPFVLSLLVEGFDEQPAPDVPKLDIPGAKVTQAGPPQPNVSRSIQIVNGRRSDSVRVTWVVRWRIEADKEGALHVPSLTVAQGSKHVTATPGDISVDTVPTTDDMRVELGLPDRPIFIGESAKATLTWLFRRDPAERPQFAIPVMSLDEITVSAPPTTDKQHAIEIEAAGKTLELPYTVDQTTVDGQKYNRLTATFFLAPRKAGKLDMPPATVVAALAVGQADFFGNSRSKLFRATDVARTLEVRPLPEQDRPASFAGAVGSQFSMAVTASRSVVQLGEPVDLAIQVKSDQALDTLALARLDGEGGLPRDKFTVPQDAPTGELSDDGKVKTFKVTVQVAGPTNEIPALAFSYFDPKSRTYQTIHSDPIALSVKSGNVVGTNDVVGATPTRSKPQAQGDGDLALVGDVDLALSAPGATNATPLGGPVLWVLIALLYALPIALLVARSWQLRTAGDREEAGEVRAARRRAEQALDIAKARPARDAAGELGAAVRNLAKVLGRAPADPVLANIETESFAPGSSDKPLPAALTEETRALVTRWLDDARRGKGKLPRAAVLLVLLAFGAPAIARAEPPATRPSDALADGRAAYADAMKAASASERKTAFARAEIALGEAARAEPGHPELLSDWGNAALGAGDVAVATLAYRRALAVDPDNTRARHNLAWLRDRQSDLYQFEAAGARDTLFFFHSWSRARRMIVGAFAFAIAILLVVPWRRGRRGWRIGLATVPLVVWIAMLTSIALEDRHADDAVVMDGVALRAADSAGAPTALPQPLPRGAEVTVVERRDAWTKVRLPGGAAGWVPSGTVQMISE